MLLLYILSHPDFDSGLQPQLPSGTWPTERGRSPKIIWFQSAKDTHRYRKRATAAARPTAPTGQQKAIQSNNPIPLIPKKKNHRIPALLLDLFILEALRLGYSTFPNAPCIVSLPTKLGDFWGIFLVHIPSPWVGPIFHFSGFTTKDISGLKTWHICPSKGDLLVTSWWGLEDEFT